MEHDWEPATLRNTRTPRNREHKDVNVRESLLSDDTSGICKGEEDTTSVVTTSFSSPDLEISAKDKLLPITDSYKETVVDFIEAKNGKCLKNDEYSDISDTETSPPVKKDKEVKIPDGGWGWVVVFSSFIISMIADGISFSFGLLYIEFLEEFEASKSTTAWIGSLFIAVPLLSGPVMSALVDRYGCRSMTILGGIISTLGFVLASISTTLEMMMITFGVIAGLGLGLVYVTAVVSIAYWFEKKRNLAVGLGACGTGVGTFVYAPMTQYFIAEYGWRGTILLLSGTLLNLCVCGCVMRDPEWWTLEQKKQKVGEENKLKKNDVKSKESSSVSIANPYEFDYDTPTRGKSMGGLIRRGVAPEKVICEEAARIKRHQNLLRLKKGDKVRQRSQSVSHLPTFLTYSDKEAMKRLDKIVKERSKEHGIEIKYPSFIINKTKTHSIKTTNVSNDPPVVIYNNPMQRANSEKYANKDEKLSRNYEIKNAKEVRILRKSKSETKEDKEMILKHDIKENKRDWFKKQLSVNHHYLKDLKMPINSISHRNALLNIKRYKLKASSCPDIFKNSMITIGEDEENWYEDCVNCLSDMFNVTLFRKMTFNLMCLGTIILFIYINYTERLKEAMKRLDKIVKERSKEHGIEIKYPSFIINKTKTHSIKTTNVSNDPPVVIYNNPMQRANSEKYANKDEKLSRNYEIKNAKEVRILRKSKSETKEDKEMILKHDIKENKRDWFKKQLSVNHHYLKDLKMPINSISHRNALLNIKRYKLKASSCPDIFKNSMITIGEDEENWYEDCVNCLSDMFNVTLFRKMTFNLMCLGTIILFIWFIVPYFYLAEHMVHKGYTEDDGAVMLSLIGITNTIGMVGLGYIGDFPKVSIGNLYAACLVLCGISVGAIPLAVSNYWILASICAAFGLLFAASFTFTPSLLVTLVSLDDFTSAYGLVLLAQGIGHLIGPPLSGLIYDLTLSWGLSFYLAGGWIVVAGALISFIQPVKSYQERRGEDEETSLA